MNRERELKRSRVADETVSIGMFLECMFREDEVKEVEVVEATTALEAQIAEVKEKEREIEQEKVVGGPPEWSENGFDAVLVDLGPLRVAMPLIKLTGVTTWPGKVTELPGQPSWILGIYTHHGRNIRIVDTASLVNPGGKTTADERRYVVLLEGGEWGLACRSVLEVFHQESADVSWRSQRGGRPWLAGTSKERLSSLLDLELFTKWMEGKGG